MEKQFVDTMAKKRRRWHWGRGALLALLLLLLLMAGDLALHRWLGADVPLAPFDAQTGDADGFDGTLRVLSYNIAHGRGAEVSGHWTTNWQSRAVVEERLERIAAFLRAEDADVVVLNEVDFSCFWNGHLDQAEFLRQRAGYTHLVRQPNVDMRALFLELRFGNAILSKYPILKAERLRCAGYSSVETALAGHKETCIAWIGLGKGRAVRVAAVHWEPRAREIRQESARALVAALESEDTPLIAAGDFNCTRYPFPGSKKAADGRTCLDLYLQESGGVTRPESTPRPEEMTFHALNPMRVIDWIVIPRGWRFLAQRVLTPKLSDHRPVVADLRWETPPPLTPPKPTPTTPESPEPGKAP